MNVTRQLQPINKINKEILKKQKTKNKSLPTPR